ncbi:copper amine oxidase N-terminal domain-containing protein [Dethiothermospora halolimnae]|uniref:copper amine oxidase N-terminal domain-containing protein n=1 Tax=Dethiothermospora halolimnae TaxID=3114390 RepID=UPI003CCBBA01
MKKLALTSILVFLIVILGAGNSIYAEEKQADIKIFIDNQELKISDEYGEPFINSDSRTLVPARAVVEGLGKKVDWNGAKQQVIIEGEHKLIIGSNIITSPSSITNMDTPAILKDGRTYLPLRFISEIFDYEVKYSFKGYHKIDIFRNLEAPEIKEDKTSSSKSIPFDKDEELKDYFSKFSKTKKYGREKYWIKNGEISFDDKGTLGPAGAIMYFYFPKSEYYDLTIRNFKRENKQVVKKLLEYSSNKTTASEIFRRLDNGFNGDGKLAITNEWLTHGDYKYIFYKQNIGVQVKIKKAVN